MKVGMSVSIERVNSPKVREITAELPIDVRPAPPGTETLTRNVGLCLLELADRWKEPPLKDHPLGRAAAALPKLAQKLKEIAEGILEYPQATDTPASSLASMISSVAGAMEMKAKEHFAEDLRIIERFTNACEALAKNLSENDPDRLSIRVTLRGSKSEMGEFGKELRAIALEQIRKAQKTAAREYDWRPVKDGDGNVVKYKAPIGSGYRPVLPPIDPDTLEGLEERAERIFQMMAASQGSIMPSMPDLSSLGGG